MKRLLVHRFYFTGESRMTNKVVVKQVCNFESYGMEMRMKGNEMVVLVG